jgi:hypothetical protein
MPILLRLQTLNKALTRANPNSIRGTQIKVARDRAKRLQMFPRKD